MAGRIPESLQKEQARWLKEWQRYMLMKNMADSRNALEVGCGCGYVMSNLSDLINITGVDSSMVEVDCARKRGLNVISGNGEKLPFQDNSFDIVYCNYLLMWNRNPEKIVEEMFRVSRKYVAFFAEPYWSGAVYSPAWLGEIVEKSKEYIANRGGDPDMGIKLPSILKNFGGDFMLGTIPLYTTAERMKKMVDFEISFLSDEGYHIKRGYVDIFYLPTFWAIAKSGR